MYIKFSNRLTAVLLKSFIIYLLLYSRVLNKSEIVKLLAKALLKSVHVTNSSKLGQLLRWSNS